MKAVTYQNFGPAEEVLRYKEMPTPTPQAGEVLVRIHASGVNPSDIRARAGGRPGVTKPPFPEIIPHSDGAGVIEAVGADVSTDRVGQRGSRNRWSSCCANCHRLWGQCDGNRRREG